ncbi:MAG: DUF177 domain-containing protein [Pseudomonadota bacterium]|jgi:uncharacterized metal-binding protein YceD (DUF177 family)|uniref:YceD family protein n=1 Tax=Actibacterium sp. TaxID=1872125 RepID=UPI00257E55D7|nr:DUF177 domain-containing protein [Actibacterium sp.]MDY6859562.1 DUF177 domain-containing protein [Pseudomonadota bacterium]
MDDRSQTLIRLAALAAGKPHTFALRPGADALTEIAARLDLLALRKLSFTGTLVPQGRSDWRLEARLGATVVQPCVVTLAPVTTRIDEPVHRTYLARMPELPAADEAEMPEDDSIEKLPETLDLAQVMEEALALALPLFPRAADAELGEAVFTEPGKAPLRDEALKPFSGLADLKKRLEEE